MNKHNATLGNITARIFHNWNIAGVVLLLACLFIAGCTQVQATPRDIHVTVAADSRQVALNVPPGTTTQAALQRAGVTLNNLDRVDPPSYAVLTDNTTVHVTRVREVFTVKENIIPFESKRLNNESLPENTELLVQQGVNGREQVTYRQVYENDKEVSNTVFKTETLTEPQPEIKMIGVQKPFTPVAIPGKLVYLSAGNAWLLETTTGNRRPVVTSGDLDGRIFSLSPKGDWLLFTRGEKKAASGAASGDGLRSTPQAPLNAAGTASGAGTPLNAAGAASGAGTPLNAAGTPSSAAAGAASGAASGTVSSTAAPTRINSLWAIDLTEEGSKPVNLKVDNVTNFAAWVPGKGLTITYSTVEPSPTEPGWQAHNDLQMLTFAPTGTVAKLDMILDKNMSGLYGWWGTDFAWSPDGAMLAYARPDEVGLVDLEKKTEVPLVKIPLYQTEKNWVWITGLSWSPDHRVLYLVNHRTSPEFENSQMAERSPLFDLAGLPIESGTLLPVVSEVGMFAYPAASPVTGPGQDFRVAYLQSREPRQSDSRPYRLAVMDRDGSNRKLLFPAEDQQGLDPQKVAWSPATFDNGHFWLAAKYQGNLYLVDGETGEYHQVTGDGSVDKIDWK